jgi:hypothetical protein
MWYDQRNSESFCNDSILTMWSYMHKMFNLKFLRLFASTLTVSVYCTRSCQRSPAAEQSFLSTKFLNPMTGLIKRLQGPLSPTGRRLTTRVLDSGQKDLQIVLVLRIDGVLPPYNPIPSQRSALVQWYFGIFVYDCLIFRYITKVGLSVIIFTLF